MRIGELAEAAGTSAPTVRYYEQVGLLPPPDRRGGQRHYDEADVRRLRFIRRCRDFGFALDQVRIMVALLGDDHRSCLQARDLAAAQLAAVREQLRELHALEAGIAGLLEAAETLCAGGPGAQCVVLEALAAEPPRPGGDDRQ